VLLLEVVLPVVSWVLSSTVTRSLRRMNRKDTTPRATSRRLHKYLITAADTNSNNSAKLKNTMEVVEPNTRAMNNLVTLVPATIVAPSPMEASNELKSQPMAVADVTAMKAVNSTVVAVATVMSPRVTVVDVVIATRDSRAMVDRVVLTNRSSIVARSLLNNVRSMVAVDKSMVRVVKMIVVVVKNTVVAVRSMVVVATNTEVGKNMVVEEETRMRGRKKVSVKLPRLSVVLLVDSLVETMKDVARDVRKVVVDGSTR
jgi:hypothetical protein